MTRTTLYQNLQERLDIALAGQHESLNANKIKSTFLEESNVFAFAQSSDCVKGAPASRDEKSLSQIHSSKTSTQPCEPLPYQSSYSFHPNNAPPPNPNSNMNDKFRRILRCIGKPMLSILEMPVKLVGLVIFWGFLLSLALFRKDGLNDMFP